MSLLSIKSDQVLIPFHYWVHLELGSSFFKFITDILPYGLSFQYLRQMFFFAEEFNNFLDFSPFPLHVKCG